MPPSENPYESPRVPDQVELPQAAAPRHGWKFVLLGVAIAGGLVSTAPWLGVLFAIASAPDFIRYFVVSRRQASASSAEPLARGAAGVLGSVGLLLSVLAACGGAFYGTCTITTWGIGLPAMASNDEGTFYSWLFGGFVVGILAGAVVGLVYLAWLLRLLFPAGGPD